MKKTKSNRFTSLSKQKKCTLLFFSLIFLCFILPMSITYFTHQYHFGKRIVHQNQYYSFLSQENPEFTRHIAHFTSNEGNQLEGAFFYQESLQQPKGLLVWVHGMGVNYENYLGEIQFLTEQGFLLFAYNNTGVDTSEGESLKGLTQAPLDLQSALFYLNEIEILQKLDLPLILIGHSWGGFSVATVSQLPLPREVDGIVTLAGFWRNINVIEDIANYYVGDVISLLVPYLALYERYLFAENAELNGISGLENTNAPVLMFHSEDDVVVNFQNNFLYYENYFKDNPRFTFHSYENAGHKLTINKESYNRIHDIMHHQMELEETDPHYLELEEERLSLILDFNQDIMGKILDFCNEIVSDS